MLARTLSLGLGIGLGLSLGLAAVMQPPRAEGADLSDRTIRKLDKRLLKSDARAGKKGLVEGGVRAAAVVDTAVPESLGRVKVKFPWFGADEASDWVRVLQRSGDERFFLPEVDDEVLVAFINGDVRFPVVIGSMWNGVDTPPDTR